MCFETFTVQSFANPMHVSSDASSYCAWVLSMAPPDRTGEKTVSEPWRDAASQSVLIIWTAGLEPPGTGSLI